MYPKVKFKQNEEITLILNRRIHYEKRKAYFQKSVKEKGPVSSTEFIKYFI